MRTPSIVVFTFCVLAAGGCASGGGSGSGVGDTRVSVGSADPGSRADAHQNLSISNDATKGEVTVEEGLPRTWAALEAMVIRHELPVTEAEPGAGRMVVRGRMPRLDGSRMSRWFDCGRDVTGPVADRAAIEVAMEFQLAPLSPERTTLSWTVQAVARPRYNSDTRLACNPRGELSEFLYEDLGADPSRGQPSGAPVSR